MSETHKHVWRFWGDDPYVICECDEIRDAISGRVIKEGRYWRKLRKEAVA